MFTDVEDRQQEELMSELRLLRDDATRSRYKEMDRSIYEGWRADA